MSNILSQQEEMSIYYCLNLIHEVVNDQCLKVDYTLDFSCNKKEKDMMKMMNVLMMIPVY